MIVGGFYLENKKQNLVSPNEGGGVRCSRGLMDSGASYHSELLRFSKGAYEQSIKDFSSALGEAWESLDLLKLSAPET